MDVNGCQMQDELRKTLESIGIYSHCQVMHWDELIQWVEIQDSDPIKQHLRRVPISASRIAEEEIQKMLDRGWIEPRESPWASPVDRIKKKDGTKQF